MKGEDRGSPVRCGPVALVGSSNGDEPRMPSQAPGLLLQVIGSLRKATKGIRQLATKQKRLKRTELGLCVPSALPAWPAPLCATSPGPC